MQNSKYTVIIGIIVIIFVITGVFGYMFYNKNNTIKEIQMKEEIQEEIQEKPVKEEILTPVQKYYKDNLEQDEVNFLNKAKTSKDNDLEFNKLHTKFMKATDVLNEKYIENLDINDSYYKNNWVKISCIEGSCFYAVNTEYFLQKYGKYLSSAYQEWLKFTLKRENVMQDGGLIIPADKLREYIIFLEKFVEQNPDFILTTDAKDFLESYLMIYLEGLDNSPIFDKWNTKKLQPEFKNSYEKFLSENKNSKFYPMVEELYNKAKEKDFSWDKDLEQWMHDYHKKYFKD